MQQYDESPSGMGIMPVMKKWLSWFALGELDSSLDATRVQERIEHTIANSGFRTLRGRVVYDEDIVVHLSPEAYEVIRRHEDEILRDIREYVLAQLKKTGWSPRNQFHVSLSPDKNLQGLAMRTDTPDADPTPDTGGGALGESPVQVYDLESKPRRYWPVPVDRETTLGRPRRDKRPGADITLDKPTLSRIHAAFRVTRDRDGTYALEVTDRSTNGTYVDGRRIPQGQPTLAHHGQTVRLGERSGVTLMVDISDSDPDATVPL